MRGKKSRGIEVKTKGNTCRRKKEMKQKGENVGGGKDGPNQGASLLRRYGNTKKKEIVNCA